MLPSSSQAFTPTLEILHSMIIILYKFPKKHYLPDFKKKYNNRITKKKEEEEEEETLICKSIQEALYDSQIRAIKLEKPQKK